MNTTTLPARDTMMQAFLARDAEYDGVFFTGVRTTGIFCRTTCPARKPRPENLEFFGSGREALLAGFRPCRRCRPLDPRGTPPPWLRDLLEAVDRDPARRWRDADLRERGLSPERVRRWFQEQHGMTFHAYSRARRLGMALGTIQVGESVLEAALDHGFESLSGFNEAFRRALGDAPTRLKTIPVVTVNRIPTPLGPMVGGATGKAVCFLEFADRRGLETQLRTLCRRTGGPVVPGTTPLLDRLAAELEGYFAGRLRRFTVPLATPGTPFQTAVWKALRRIPYGSTISYSELAGRIGRPTAVRAVAKANGDNRIAVIIPCHRVVGADGRLTGYGGGLWRKQRLLDLETGNRG